MKKPVGEVAASTHLKNNNSIVKMIIECDVSIKEIMEQGKKFAWTKPETCPGCNDTVLWGHGFVLCYFSCVAEGVYLKRFRCCGCKAVIKLKPCGYFNQFRTAITVIKQSIKNRIRKKRFLPGIPRERQDHWLRNLKRNISACLGEMFKSRLLEGFQKLMDMNIIPVSCTGHPMARFILDTPYRVSL